MILLTDLKPFFKDGLLRAMDKTVLLCLVVHRKSIDTVEKFEDVQTSRADKLIEDIFLDEANNLKGVLYIKGNKHTFTFNCHSKGRRGLLLAEYLQQIKEILNKIKEDVFKNAQKNLSSLAVKEDTSFFFWSAFDLEEKATLDDRVNRLRPLLQRLCNEKVHQVLSMGNEENNLKGDVWQGYTVHFIHPKRLLGFEVVVEQEFCDAWPVLTRS